MLTEKWIRLIQDKEVSFIKITPSHLNILVNHDDFEEEIKACKLNKIVLGGEAINVTDVGKVFKINDQFKVYNHYGPTESTIGCTYKEITNETFTKFKKTPVIGTPLGENKIYLMDELGKLTPKGVPGEICVSGRGVAKGYYKNVELTNLKFIKNPFEEDVTLYKTGDIGILTEDDNIKFLGRKDHQVKVRGYRIEIEGVKSVVNRFESIKKSLVQIEEESNGQNKLVCYYTVHKPFENDELKKFMETYLPNYMIPTNFIEVGAFDLTPNGKINTKTLVNLVKETIEKIEAPINNIERKLHEVWSDVLEQKELSRHANFFTIGGDSIKAIQIASRLSKYGYKIGVKEIFENPKLSELALVTKN